MSLDNPLDRTHKKKVKFICASISQYLPLVFLIFDLIISTGSFYSSTFDFFKYYFSFSQFVFFPHLQINASFSYFSPSKMWWGPSLHHSLIIHYIIVRLQRFRNPHTINIYSFQSIVKAYLKDLLIIQERNTMIDGLLVLLLFIKAHFFSSSFFKTWVGCLY